MSHQIGIEKVRSALENVEGVRTGAAVVIPLVQKEEGLEVLLEVRAHDLDVQPGEVCLPGGHIEAGESPREAAIREACEELLIDASQLNVVGEIGAMEGPGGRPLYVFVAELIGYEGSFSPDEVDRTFSVSLDWLVDNAPRWYGVAQEPQFPEDFPWDLVPGGRSYPWKARLSNVPFYLGTDPLIWGATARILARFARMVM